MTNYYDVVLGLIPLAFGGIGTALFLAGASLTTAAGLSGGLSLAVIAHAMFVRAPVGAGGAVARGRAGADAPAAEQGFQSAD